MLGGLLAEPGQRARLARGAIAHAQQFSWNQTAAGLLAVYRDAVSQQRIAATNLAAVR